MFKRQSVLLAALLLTGCATFDPPAISKVAALLNILGIAVLCALCFSIGWQSCEDQHKREKDYDDDL